MQTGNKIAIIIIIIMHLNVSCMLQESTFKINSIDDKEKLVVLYKIQHYIVTWEDARLR